MLAPFVLERTGGDQRMPGAVESSVSLGLLAGSVVTTIMRENVPVEMQGRVFSAQDTLKNGTIPLGLFLGGVLADGVFGSLMETPSPVRQILAVFFGDGKGAGIAVIFFCAGLLGIAISLTGLGKPAYNVLTGGSDE